MRKREAFTGIFARHFNRNGASHGEAQSSESCGKSNFACVSGYNVSVSAKRLRAFSRGISTEMRLIMNKKRKNAFNHIRR